MKFHRARKRTDRDGDWDRERRLKTGLGDHLLILYRITCHECEDTFDAVMLYQAADAGWKVIGERALCPTHAAEARP